MAKRPPTPPASADPFDALAEVLRTLFASKAKSMPGPCPVCGDSPCSCDEPSEDDDDDAYARGPRGPMGPMGGKPMRHVSISILMPMGQRGKGGPPPTKA